MNVIQISQKFPTEIDALLYFEGIRWKNKPKCPYCKSKNIGDRNKDFRFHCKNCQKSFSVTTGTMLHQTHIDFKTWLFAFSIIGDAKKGLSAMQLQRNLNISYPTAWTMYHKIRDLMAIENDAIRLDNVLEIDSTGIGGKPRKFQYESKGTPKVIPELDKEKAFYEKQGFEFKEGEYKKPAKIGNQKRGKGSYKAEIPGIVQRDGNIIAEVVKRTNFNELNKLIEKYVEKENCVLLMDEDTAQVKLSKIIDSIKIDHSKMYSYRGLNTNSIESFWAIIKRQILGQHHSVSVRHLSKYVAETVFKYNNRNEDDMFETLVRFSMMDNPNIN